MSSKRNKNGTFKKIHGESKTRLYSIWHGIMTRCYNKNAINYKFYGKLGTKVTDEWHDFITFKQWAVSNGYEKTLTIDRINTKDNYYPENCRWVTYTKQAQNRKIRKDNNAGYSGINMVKSGKWRVRISIDGKRKQIGNFDSLDDAIKAKKRAEKELWR